MSVDCHRSDAATRNPSAWLHFHKLAMLNRGDDLPVERAVHTQSLLCSGEMNRKRRRCLGRTTGTPLAVEHHRFADAVIREDADPLVVVSTICGCSGGWSAS